MPQRSTSLPAHCSEARALLERGWGDGLPEGDFRKVASHVAACPSCASVVRRWYAVDGSLQRLASVRDQAAPRASISARVADALAREAVPAPDPAEDAELARFLERFGNDAALHDTLLRVADRGERYTLLVTVARERGFRFTEAAVERTLLQQDAANDGELTDDQLAAVAGGASSAAALLQVLLKS